MERKNANFQTDAPHTAEAESNLGGLANNNPYGKFKDASSLLKAYESLEAEFTRRSQKLKALEGELSNRTSKEQTDLKVGETFGEGDFFGQYPLSLERKEKIEAKLPDFKGSKTPMLNAYVKILEEEITSAKSNPIGKEKTPESDLYDGIVKDYLKKIAEKRSASVFTGGGILTCPPLKPTTIAEASAIAKNYIKKSPIE